MRPDLDLLADPARRLILALLWHEQELCVCEVEAATGLLQPVVSRQLGALRDGGWVMARRAGRWMFYRLTADMPAWSYDLIAALAAGGVPDAELQRARARIADFSGRPSMLMRSAS